MAMQINGMNVSEIKEVQDILTALLTLQYQQEDCSKNMEVLFHKSMEISQFNAKIYSNINDLIKRASEVQTNQSLFIKNQRTDLDNLLNQVNKKYEQIITECKNLYFYIKDKNEGVQEHTEKAVSEALAKVNFEAMTKEVENSFQEKLTSFQTFNTELEDLMAKTDQNIDLLKTNLEEFDHETNMTNMLLKFLSWVIIVGGAFALGVFLEPVLSFCKEVLFVVLG